MPFYADYFEIKYDLPKLDMIAVPTLSFGVYLMITCIILNLSLNSDLTCHLIKFIIYNNQSL